MANFIFLLTVSLLINTSEQFTYEKRTIDTGITFIQLNKAAITHTKWQLCYFYDLAEYFELTKQIQTAIISIETLCITPNDTECEILLNLLKSHMENSYINAARVESFTSRERRWAPLGYIGDFNSLIFGYATQEDIQPMVINIRKLQKQAIEQRDLIEKQILIT